MFNRFYFLKKFRFEILRQQCSIISSTPMFPGQIEFNKLLEEINKLSVQNNIEEFSAEELENALGVMDSREILYTDGIVYFV